MDIRQPSATPCLEMAHVLFMDIVAYSTLPMDKQQRLLADLQELVRGSSEFVRAQAEDQLIRLPTGDGMALVFFHDPEAPVRCALELSRSLRERPEIKLRMGIHTGPVYRVADINANRNVAGGGINIAQRVMDCGDAGHILISKNSADVLGHLSSWSGALHDLGLAKVKHGEHVHVFNLRYQGLGNPEVPNRLRTRSLTLGFRRHFITVSIGVATVALIAVALNFHYFSAPSRKIPAPTQAQAPPEPTSPSSQEESASAQPPSASPPQKMGPPPDRRRAEVEERIKNAGATAEVAGHPGLVRVGGDIKRPREIYAPPPEFPVSAKQAKATGTVVLDAVIDERGNVIRVRPVSGNGLLIDAALKAVSKWKYEPTYLNGVPVSVEMEVEVHFNQTTKKPR